MRRIKTIFQSAGTAVVMTGLLTAGSPAAAGAASVDEPSLIISQLKITGSNGQFITLYNTSDGVLDLSNYRLEYFNNYDLGKVTSSRLIGLAGKVPPHGYFMVNDDSLILCYRLAVQSVSLGLSSTAGMVQISRVSQSQPGGQAVSVLQDYVGWSKKAAPGAQTLPADTDAFLVRQPADDHGNPSVVKSGSGAWQSVRPDPADACRLVSASDDTVIIQTGPGTLLPSGEPPATILPTNAVSSVSEVSLPAADIGLKAPTITELLPNPAGTGNDASDEFIELYNDNGVAFDLSGFSLQAGTGSPHTYKFPAGSSLPPHGFKAFYSSATGLSLSNSGGQAKLLDPFGNSITASAVYGTAKDGLSWALANGKWYWTTRLTPGLPNVINQPPAKSKSTKSKSSKSRAVKTSGKSSKRSAAGAANGQAYDAPTDMPIHFRSLALVGAGALLYGTYEYREDIKNKVYELRSHLRTRREGRA